MNAEKSTIAVGQRWRDREYARSCQNRGLDVELADVEIVGIDWAQSRARCKLPSGGESWRKLRRITERCELLPSPPPPVEWRGIGGSQAAAAVGEHPYCPPIQVWSELAGELPPFAGNRFTKWGKLLEGPIRDDYADRHGYRVLVPTGPYYHPDKPWARATPDGLVAGSHGVEIKTADVRSLERWGDDGSDEVPAEYRIQCDWYMWIYDLGRWDVVVLFGGNELREYHLERDLAKEQVLVPAVEYFWHEYVEAKVPPELDGSTAYTEYLQRRHTFKRHEYLPATAESLEIAESLRVRMREAKALEQVIDLHKNQLREIIGDAAGLDLGELGRISYKLERGKVSWKKVAEQLIARLSLGKDEAAELIEQQRGQEHRVLRPPQKWSRTK